MTLSTKTAVRVFSFTAATMVALLGMVIASSAQTRYYRRQMESNYIRAVQEVSSNLNAVSTGMQKTAYAGSPAQTATLSAQIARDAGAAKAALGNLPLQGVSLDNTNRFLSQAGDYSLYLSRKAAGGQELTQEERENYEKLTRYAINLNEQIAGIERALASGTVNLTSFLEEELAGAEDELSAVAVGLGFRDVEEGFDGYPTLIYDGPFSDNLLEKSPTLTRSKPEVSRTEAASIAAAYAGVEPKELSNGDDEQSRMPSYTFHGESVDVGVTRQGGFVTYLLNSRSIGAAKLTIPQALERGAAYLEQHGLESMAESYYLLSGNILTINYAYRQDGVICYTDLIKVGIAMDRGDVVFYDARGFINNHRNRKLEEPALSPEDAAAGLSPSLSPRSVALALIPTGGNSEVLAYEFTCSGLNGEDVLVYRNAQTGAEEQILILLENENGTLTR